MILKVFKLKFTKLFYWCVGGDDGDGEQLGVGMLSIPELTMR